MVLGRKEISVLLLAIGALLFFGVFLLSVSSDAQMGGGSTGGGSTGAARQAQNTPAPAKSADAQAEAGDGGASAKSSRDRQKNNVVPKTTPRRPLPPTGGLPVSSSVLVTGFVVVGAGLLGLGLVRRGGRRR